MVIVYVIIITSITNLSLQNRSTELWISLLSSCIGYTLPNPKLKKWSLPCLLNPAPAFASVDRRKAEKRDGFTNFWLTFGTCIVEIRLARFYCYRINQPLFDEMEQTVKNFRSKQGLPSSEELEEFTTDRHHKLILIDDLMHRVVEDKEMELLFTQRTHHKWVSVILITQNLYPRGKHAMTIALNTWYLVLMKNLRDVSQVGILGGPG